MTTKRIIDLEISWLDKLGFVVHTTRYPLPEGDELRLHPYPELTGLECRNSNGIVIPIPEEQRVAIEKAYQDNISWVQIVVKRVTEE